MWSLASFRAEFGQTYFVFVAMSVAIFVLLGPQAKVVDRIRSIHVEKNQQEQLFQDLAKLLSLHKKF